MTRKYVRGPGYADGIVYQLDYSADPSGGTGVEPETYYYLQDANYNVVGVVAPAASQNPAAVLYQYTYGPYGDVLALDDFTGGTGPVNRIGHQGLFFERLTTGSVTSPMLAVGARGLYNSRNRWLHVELGRFLTRDPAGAALLDVIAGPFFSSICFVAGTEVLTADGSLRPIEDITAGRRVRSDPDPLEPPCKRNAGASPRGRGPRVADTTPSITAGEY